MAGLVVLGALLPLQLNCSLRIRMVSCSLGTTVCCAAGPPDVLNRLSNLPGAVTGKLLLLKALLLALASPCLHHI